MVVEIMKQAADYAAEKGVILGLENQKGLTETADLCLEILHRVNSPFAGITLDITHYFATTTEEEFRAICKFFQPPSLAEGFKLSSRAAASDAND